MKSYFSSTRSVLSGAILTLFAIVLVSSQAYAQESGFSDLEQIDVRAKAGETLVPRSVSNEPIGTAVEPGHKPLSFVFPGKEIAAASEFNPLRPSIKKPVKFPLITDPPEPPSGDKNKNVVEDEFHLQAALAQSGLFLAIQHSLRMIQLKTRREIDGKFFADWGNSVKNLGGWGDGDGLITNYVNHPMQGVVTGRIFVNNSEHAKRQEFGKSSEYWKSRFRAFVWTTAWSTQFELGPISEASIGNVGLYDRVGPNHMGWVDMVITPTAGTALLIGEDMIDKYILKNWLENTKSRTRIKIYRTFFTPFQSFTNILNGKVPWKRKYRSLHKPGKRRSK